MHTVKHDVLSQTESGGFCEQTPGRLLQLWFPGTLCLRVPGTIGFNLSGPFVFATYFCRAYDLIEYC